MRLFDAKSQNWAIRHIYVIMALAGLAMLAATGYLSERNQVLLSECASYYDETGSDCPNFMYLHDGGDAAVASATGLGLLILSPIIAVGYLLIRRGARFEELKLKGSNVA